MHLSSRNRVAPLVGAWIEIAVITFDISSSAVAPLVGAWIEIPKALNYRRCQRSLPSWERGLKYVSACSFSRILKVAPLVGAWIEICPV